VDEEKEFFTILEGGHITTMYQPIISLQNGSVLGYEALSRIKIPSCLLNIEQLFTIAAETKRLWELEKLCRTEALKNAAAKPRVAKLFINVDPNIIEDRELKSGFTCEKLREYGLDPNDIVFEVTERSAVKTMSAFTAAIEHYQRQNFKIAIDDFGSGYSGLNRACSCSPNYIKIDMGIIQGIDVDAYKKSAVSSIVKFCREIGIHLIAEGIETEAELATVIRLGVDYGQGYYLARPSEQFHELNYELKLAIKDIHHRISTLSYQPSVFGKIDSIAREKITVGLNAKALSIYEMMQHDEALTEVCIIDEERHVCGILTRAYLFERFSGQFGYNLSAKRTTGQLMTKNFLSVERDATIDDVAMLAMNRKAAQVYDSVVVTGGTQYFGVVTVKDLLMTAVNIQVQRASEANPLTGLPGNAAIQGKISSILTSEESFSIIYLDLDNFKAYNDAYGFSNGDLMIKAVADSMRECCSEDDFMGHIGGDDFVIILHRHEENHLCNAIISAFNSAIEPLYSTEDWSQGFIVSKNRNGFTENFSTATLSIAVVTNHAHTYQSLEDLSKVIAHAKKQCKQIQGNSVVII